MPNLKRLIRNGNYFYFKNAPIHISGVSLDKHVISFKEVGQTVQLTATVTPEDAVDDNSVSWSSSDTSIATVSDTGLVTCVTLGDCTITVTTNYGGFTDTCSVMEFVPVDQLFSYTGTEQSLLLQPSTYCLEVWGAEGGYTEYAGKGGYSGGCIELSDATCLYIYVGGTSSRGTSVAGGYNGGGAGGNYGGYSPGGGGGATDIRIGGNTLYHRRIVAGGGGGGGTNHGGDYGGPGGGICGGKGCDASCSSTTAYSTVVATQTSGAAFGIGSAGCSGSGGGGGGGGWYGGGGTYWEGGSGGSGYVYNSSTCGDAPSGYCHCTDYLLTNSITCCGTVSFPSPSGGTETGHCGCGCVRIRSI